MDTNGQDAKQRDRPGPGKRLSGWFRRWGADLLLVLGGACVSAGVWRIYPPAGAIAAGALLIAGGVLLAKGGNDE